MTLDYYATPVRWVAADLAELPRDASPPERRLIGDCRFYALGTSAPRVSKPFIGGRFEPGA